MNRLTRKCRVAECDKRVWAREMCRMHYARWNKHGDENTVLTKQSPAGAPWAFMAAAIVISTDECIYWPYSKNNMGYAQINEKGAAGKRLVTRRVCLAVYGEAPTPTHVAAHGCGNGHLGCINPRHLRWAMPAENSQEMVAHGRSSRGRSMAKIPLNAKQILEIYRRAHAGENQYQIASEFGIAQTAVSSIKRGKNWGWLTVGVEPRALSAEAA